ncbi:MAG: C1 family peptidase [Bacteroidales bacterium]
MKRILLIGLVILSVSVMVRGQQAGYSFTIKKEMACTPVKNQNASNTCWCFSGISLFESEMIRMGKKPVDLSVMYIVHQTYNKKADMFARMHGNSTLAGGGEYGDVISGSREKGLVPESVYQGLNYGEAKHNHNELDGVVKGYMDALIKSSRPTTAWAAGLDGILNAYLGEMPRSFTYEGKNYTPESYMKESGINPDDYIVFTSFIHHPFYKEMLLEVPDNWAGGLFHNLPLDEFMQVIDNALNNGYTVAWASDISDRGFSMKEGVAVVPEKNWNEMTPEESSKVFSGPQKERLITQELRQKEFDNYSTTDDHGMHIVGIATDQAGNTFYKVKNSWGITGKYNGYLYVSKAFVMLRTTNCMVHKNAVPPAIAKKLGL